MCMCVCVSPQIIHITLKLRGSTMMRPNHEFWSSVALSLGFRNWVEMTRNMQQEGVGLVCVCVCVPRQQLQLYSNCDLLSYAGCNTHEFTVRWRGGADHWAHPLAGPCMSARSAGTPPHRVPLGHVPPQRPGRRPDQTSTTRLSWRST
jgi:hypothetical protein